MTADDPIQLKGWHQFTSEAIEGYLYLVNLDREVCEDCAVMELESIIEDMALGNRYTFEEVVEAATNAGRHSLEVCQIRGCYRAIEADGVLVDSNQFAGPVPDWRRIYQHAAGEYTDAIIELLESHDPAVWAQGIELHKQVCPPSADRAAEEIANNLSWFHDDGERKVIR